MEVKNMCRKCNSNECLIIAIASSIVVGIVAGILAATGIITITPAFLWVVFGIAIGYLAIAFIVSSLRRFDTPYSARSIIGLFLAGVFTTILISLVLLGVTFAATSPVAAVLAGLLLAGFWLIITSVGCIVWGAYTNDD